MAGVGGSETYHLNLLPALACEGIPSAFLALERNHEQGLNDEFLDQLQQAGVDVIRVTYSRATSWSLMREIARIVREGEYDLVQSNLIHADVWMSAVKRLFIPRLPLVSTKHGYIESFQLMHGFDPKAVRHDRLAVATRLASKNADRIVVISRALGDFFTRARLIDQKKIEIVPYGIGFDHAVSRTSAGELRFSPTQLVTVGRLIPVKQHELLLRAISLIVRDHPEVKLVVVGDGRERQRLETIASELGVSDAVHWAGYADNVHDYLRDSDIFLLPSASEGFGAVILEAWHHKLPAVAFDVPAPNEIITHGLDGLLVTPFDVEDLAGVLIRLIREPQLRRQMGEKGQHTLQSRYSIERMTSDTVRVYESVLAMGRTSRSTARQFARSKAHEPAEG